MPVPRLIPAVLLLGAIGPQAMGADGPHGSCLTRAEQRAAVDDHKAISLGQAIKSLRQYRKYSEVVRARLCRRDDKLVYVLTLLGRSGKVVDVTIDAINGQFNAGSGVENNALRLLVIEDDPDLSRQLATALTDAGYVVDRAFDGEEGHYLGESEPYDAVILDIGLPKMDGISVLEAWRRTGRAMPVLILTARDRWSDKVQGF